ncbi:MAG: hypothetical protein WC516_05110 [Patescibacteria group bacterium]
MSNDVRQVRKVARCIHTLLETEGIKVTATKVMDLIKDKDLSDINTLKVEVANNMRTPATQSKASRKQRIETFIVSNWNVIKSSDEIKEALFNAYCQGRYNKDQRSQMKTNLLFRCESNQTQIQIASTSVHIIPTEELADDATAELASTLLGYNTKYDF